MLSKIKDKIVYLFSGYFSQLLVFLILLFLFRPYNRGLIYIGIWEFFVTCVFIAAIFNAHHPKAIKIICVCLAIPALVLDWITLHTFITDFALLSLVLTLFFMVICTASILYNVVLRARVTLETLRGVICAYFMIGFVFSLIYMIVEYITPGSFRLPSGDNMPFFYATEFLSKMVYFSFITLLTIGFGDIVAMSDLAQTFVIIEGILGQFYIAILVSRIVGVYSSYTEKGLVKSIHEDIKNLSTKLKK